MRAIIFALALQLSCAFAVDLRSVIDNPRAYHQQRVSVTGYALGEGPAFELFESAAAINSKDSERRSVYVRADGNLSRITGYDLRRVRVTGIVDATRHGIWGNPCELALQGIEVLRGPLAVPSMPFAAFRNDRSDSVLVFLYDGNGVQAQFEVPPQRVVTTPIRNGTVKVFTPRKSLIATEPLRVANNSEYFDRKTGMFYYQITDAGIERLMPAAVDRRAWRL